MSSGYERKKKYDRQRTERAFSFVALPPLSFCRDSEQTETVRQRKGGPKMRHNKKETNRERNTEIDSEKRPKREIVTNDGVQLNDGIFNN